MKNISKNYVIFFLSFWAFISLQSFSYDAGNIYVKTATTTSGVSTFYLTSDGTINGTALYKNNIMAVMPIVNDANANYTYGWTVSVDKKTLTVTTKTSAGVYVALLNLTVLSAPTNVSNGTSVTVVVKGN